MAPEQADAKHVDGAADRYAFGLLAYALLSGRMPWDEGTSEARVLVAKMTGQLVPLAQARPGLPEGVYASVTRMLALAPAERLETCAALVERIRQAETNAARLRSERVHAAARALHEREQSTTREREARERANHTRREREAQARAAEQRAARVEINRRWQRRAAGSTRSSRPSPSCRPSRPSRRTSVAPS
jgi:serine/threonine-protein kinase